MPATAGRVRMPANNRVHSSAALQTHGIWQSAIGYDPYAPATNNTKPESKPDNNAYASFQGLLALARVTGGANSSETRGACKKCGRVGHLTYQCRNFLTLTPLKDDDGDKLPPPQQRNYDPSIETKKESETDDDDDDDESSSSDSSIDPEIERIIAERFGKRMSKKVESLKTRSDRDDDGDDDERRKNRSKRRSCGHHRRTRRRRDSDSDDRSSDDDSIEERKRSKRHRKRRRRMHRERRSVLSSDSESSGSSSSSDDDERRGRKEKKRSRGQ